MQMYKVFFKDRIILLSNNKENKTNNVFSHIFEYSTPDKLKEFVLDFQNRKMKGNAFIYHSNIDELKQEFDKCFRIIAAAGGVVYNSNDEILFIFRNEKWDLPKGKIEKGENIEEAALREVEEECSVTNLKIEKLIKCTYHTYFLNEEPILKPTYWFQMKYDGTETPKPQIEEGITKVKWVNKDNVKQIMKDSYLSLKEIFK